MYPILFLFMKENFGEYGEPINNIKLNTRKIFMWAIACIEFEPSATEDLQCGEMRSISFYRLTSISTYPSLVVYFFYVENMKPFFLFVFSFWLLVGEEKRAKLCPDVFVYSFLLRVGILNWTSERFSFSMLLEFWYFLSWQCLSMNSTEYLGMGKRFSTKHPKFSATSKLQVNDFKFRFKYIFYPYKISEF